MDNCRVKDLMVPLSEYAKVPEGSTLLDAVLALEKAQEEFDHTRYRHRGVLILDKNNRVIGKLGQMDVLRALELQNIPQETPIDLGQFGFSQAFIHMLRKQSPLMGPPLTDICRKAIELKVKDFMQTPTEGDYVEENSTMETAIHQLVMGNHYALLVTQGKEIVGVLRATDVFAAVFHTMKEYNTHGG